MDASKQRYDLMNTYNRRAVVFGERARCIRTEANALSVLNLDYDMRVPERLEKQLRSIASDLQSLANINELFVNQLESEFTDGRED